jgi:hypothetical protein
MEQEIALLLDEAYWQKKYPPGKGTPKTKSDLNEPDTNLH